MHGKRMGSAATALLAAVAAFAVGIGVGWLLFAQTGEQPEAAPATAPAAATASESPAAGTPSRSRASAVTGKLAPATESAIASATAARFDFPQLRGTGVIRGRVTTEAGAPLAGVEIRAFAYTPPEWNEENRGQSWDEVSLDDTLRQMVRSRRWWEASKKSATSAADGKYELTGLADLNWAVTARGEGYSCSARGEFDPARAGTVLDFVATPSVRFDLDVRLPDGSRPQRAQIEWTQAGSDSTNGDGWWPGRPFMEMKPGKWRISAKGGEDERFAAAPVEVEIRTGMDPLVVTLKPRNGVVAVATKPDGVEGLRLRFFLARAEGTDPTDDELRAERSGSSRWSSGWDEMPDEMFVVANDGRGDADRRAWMDLAPGRWIVAAGFDGAALARRIVEVRSGVTECELAVPAPDITQFVEVHVADPDGAAVSSASFDWQYRAKRENASYSAQAIARGDGVWLVRRVGPGDRPHSQSRNGPRDLSGSWLLIVNADRFVTEETAVAAGVTRVDVRLRAPAIALVTVTGLPQGVSVKRFSAWIGETGHGADGADADGAWRIGPIAPGSHKLRLSLNIGGWTSITIAQRTVDLVAGENAVAIQAPALHPLDLDLGTARAGSVCMLEFVVADIDTDTIHVELDEAGRAKLDLVPAGTYRVREDDNEHEFRVPQTRTFKLP